jgi:hypothetical protein
LRIVLILFFCLFCNFIFAQTIEKFYDSNWKPSNLSNASFYSNIRETDSGWYRIDVYLFTKKIQMVGLYEDSACTIKNGTFCYYYANGTPSSYGRYEHNIRQGVFAGYYSNGKKKNYAEYNNGYLQGSSLSWNMNGSLADSIFEDKNNAYIEKTWFDNGNISSVGILLNDKMQGTWKFFDVNGRLTSIEEYDTGNVINRQYFDTSGKALVDTTNTDAEVKFKNGKKDLQKYVDKHLQWPDYYHISQSDHATLVIDMLINEKGEVQYVEVVCPIHPTFDSLALKAFRKAPNFNPAREHNRSVASWVRQSITYYQDFPYLMVSPND